MVFTYIVYLCIKNIYQSDITIYNLYIHSLLCSENIYQSDITIYLKLKLFFSYTNTYALINIYIFQKYLLIQ